MIAVEPVSLVDLMKFADRLELGDGHEVADTLAFAETLMTNIGSKAVLARIEKLRGGRARKAADALEEACLSLDQSPSYRAVVALLSECSRQTGSRIFRPGVLLHAINSLNAAENEPEISFSDAVVRIREENRAVGRQLPTYAIGSTLLLKGLEADHVVVLNGDDLDACNLYVAITRGAKTVTVCSRSSVLTPT